MLSEPLRDEIYAHIHGIVIKLCPIFEQYEAHFISQLTRALESETYAPGDTVIEEGEMSTKMYFIQNGKIDIFHHSTKSTFKDLGPREYFGEIAFFTEKPRCASAKCLDFVDLLSLSRVNMNQLLEKFPEAKESTELLAKKCEDNDFSTLLVKCYICKELGHVAIKCKKILLNLDKDETKRKWLEKRGAPETKRVYPIDSIEPNYNRVPKMKLKKSHKIRNISGAPRPTVKMFPNDPKMYPKIRDYVEKFQQNQSGFNSNTGGNSGLDLQPLQTFGQKRKTHPKYTMIYLDSENSEEENQDVSPELDVKVTRSKKFRMSLLDRLATYGGEQQQEKVKNMIERSFSVNEDRNESLGIMNSPKLSSQISREVPKEREESKFEISSSIDAEEEPKNLLLDEKIHFKAEPMSPNPYNRALPTPLNSEYEEGEEERDL